MKKSVKTSTVVIYGFLVLAVGVFMLTLFWNEINTTSDKILNIIPMIGFVITLIVMITFVVVVVVAVIITIITKQRSKRLKQRNEAASTPKEKL
jgi:TRAP-type C4-dicarboxylate transport system permease small subunit